MNVYSEVSCYWAQGIYVRKIRNHSLIWHFNALNTKCIWKLNEWKPFQNCRDIYNVLPNLFPSSGRSKISQTGDANRSVQDKHLLFGKMNVEKNWKKNWKKLDREEAFRPWIPPNPPAFDIFSQIWVLAIEFFTNSSQYKYGNIVNFVLGLPSELDYTIPLTILLLSPTSNFIFTNIISCTKERKLQIYWNTKLTLLYTLAYDSVWQYDN